MEYIAEVYAGSLNGDCVWVKSYNSLDYPGTPGCGSNAYDSARCFVVEQLETHDFVKMKFKTSERALVEDLWAGAFSHPLRGRCKGICTPKEFSEHMQKLHEAADKPIYSPNQLYAMTPVGVETKDILWDLMKQWFKAPFNLEYLEYQEGYKELETAVESAARIQLRYLACVGFGSDEAWKLATLWFDDKPVAILTQQGEDGYSAYTTDRESLYQMVEWVRSLAPRPKEGGGDVDPDKPMEALTEFWNHTLHDFYDVETGKRTKPPKYGPRTAWNHYGVRYDAIEEDSSILP